MEGSPPKQLLEEAVLYLEEKIDDVEQRAEQYVEAKVHEVKKDTFKKASDIPKDQKAQRQQTAEDFEEKARDQCEAQVAQSRAAVIGEAWGAINEKERLAQKEASKVASLMTHLSQAQSHAEQEKATASNIESQA